MIFEQPKWEITRFEKEDIVCASGIDLPGQDLGGTDKNITKPQGEGGISGPVIPLP